MMEKQVNKNDKNEIEITGLEKENCQLKTELAETKKELTKSQGLVLDWLKAEKKSPCDCY